MRVVIASAARDSVASRALSVEGIDVVVVVCRGDYGYGNLLADLWTTGGFVLVEDDIAPWPGAIAELIDCPRSWCAFDYPIGGGRMISSCSHWGLGLVKVKSQSTRRSPTSPARLERTYTSRRSRTPVSSGRDHQLEINSKWSSAWWA